jgi:hypothetical protein
MINYKIRILNWLKREFINTDRDRSDESIDAHVTMFSDTEKYEDFLHEGLKIFDEFVALSKENGWTSDFVPTLRVNMKNTRAIRKMDILSVDDIIREMSDSPPEIMLWKKILLTNIGDNFVETYERSLHEEFNRIFNHVFPNDYKIYYKAYKYVYFGKVLCQRKIYIQYNENNACIVRDIRKLKLKDKSSIELLKKIREEEKTSNEAD